MTERFSQKLRTEWVFWMLAAFMVLASLTGGSARADVQSLVILRPVAAVILGFGIWGLERAQLREFRVLLYFALACLTLLLLHLIPLPPFLWTALPGHELAAQADELAGIAHPWRPLSLIPVRTVNALCSLVVPGAVLILAIRCTKEQRYRLLGLMILLGLASGVLGILQAVGPASGPLYLYKVTNEGSAVGFFANRNHQAALLAGIFPMLAIYTSTGIRSVEQARLRTWLALGGGSVLIPLLLVTGSRAGLILGALGIVAAALLYRRPLVTKPAKRKVRKIDPRFVFIGGAAMVLVALTALLSRASALQRLLAPDEVDGMRTAILRPIWNLLVTYFPFGSGLGTFLEVYKVSETDGSLSPSYVNHAHNDWLELVMTGGAPALVLLLVAVGLWIVASWRAFGSWSERGREVLFARLGSILVLMLGLASFADYPLRVPSLAVVFTISAVWMASLFHGREAR